MNNNIYNLKIGVIGVILCVILLSADCPVYILSEGKAIYIPEEYSSDDWSQDTSRYSYHRMSCTENIVVLWEKGFGNDLSTAPDLDGNPMSVDLENLKEKLDRFYHCFRDTLKFVKESSLSEKYRMMCMIQYSSEGTAYGGTYDDKIGALWVTPFRLKDPKLNVLAHELGHSFQSQIMADGQGEAWGGSGFFEMASQWMLWYVNPNWVTDENYHWQAFKENTHKSFLNIENIYRSPYILESWSEKHGLPFIAEMFREGTKEEDPILTYKRMTDISWETFSDEMFRNYQQLVNFDYTHSYNYTRQWANSFSPFLERMDKTETGWYRVKSEFYPENYGFNVIQLSVPEAGETVEVEFKGLSHNSDDVKIPYSLSGWRYGFVGVKEKDGTSIKSEIYRDKDGVAIFPVTEKLSHIWFIVMGAPTEYGKGLEDQYPYAVRVSGASVL